MELASSPGPWAGGWLFHEPGCMKKRDRFGDGVGWSGPPHFPPQDACPAGHCQLPETCWSEQTFRFVQLDGGLWMAAQFLLLRRLHVVRVWGQLLP